MWAERFHVEPQHVNPSVLWWFRVDALEEYRSKRRAREFVDEHSLAKADRDTQRLYDALMKELRHG